MSGVFKSQYITDGTERESQTHITRVPSAGRATPSLGSRSYPLPSPICPRGLWKARSCLPHFLSYQGAPKSIRGLT